METLANFHFMRPLWLLALLPCAGLLAWLWYRYRPRGNWQQVIDPALLGALTEDSPAKASRLPLVLCAIAWLLGVIALAGPSWQQLPQPAFQKQDALIILLDLSPSMYATDISPSRLERAKREVRDVLEMRNEGLTGLIAYAGDAHVVTPLTDDTETIELLLPSLAPAMMPSIGNQPIRAMELAGELAASNPGQQTRVLFITDDIPESDFKALQALAKKNNLQVAVLAVGTPEGAPIPLTQGGFLKNSRGEVVVAKMDGRAMERWAERIGGRYHISTFDDDDINYLLQPDLADTALPGQLDMESQQQFDVWRDAGPWIVLAILPFALLAFRRGWLLGLVLAGMLPSGETLAWSWADLWLSEDQQGSRALEEGDPARAAELFEDEQWQGVSRYRSGDYAGAADAFGTQDSGQAHYNRGNALARDGQLEAALQAYDRALELDPDNADAAANREIVEEALEQQQQQQQQQSGEGENDGEQDQRESGEQDQSGNDSRDGNDDQSGQQDQGENNGPQDESSSGEDGEPQGDQDQAGEQESGLEQGEDQQDSADGEEQQALEQEAEVEDETQREGEEAARQRSPEEDERLQQWLRQIPDEPGDLLQRKFDYQYRQLQRRGGGEAVEERY